MANPLSQVNLPHRFQEGSFRKYEAAIEYVVIAFPLAVELATGGLSTTTFSCRLRDAMKSLHLYRWPTQVDLDRFDDIYGHIVVAERDGCVIAGSKDNVRTWKAQPAAAVAPQEPFDLTIEPREVGLIALLAHHKLFVRPIRLIGLASLPNELDNFDILVTNNKDGTFTII